MAKQDKQDQKVENVSVPTEFPKEQLFVAVSDNDGPAAGEDGGPVVGGRGAWAKGTVGQWTSTNRIPLAVRDPKDGLIAKGWVEPVISQEYGPNSKIVTVSQKYYGERLENGEWVMREPTPQALKRANLGATSITRALPQSAQIPSLGSYGIPVLR